MNRDERIKAMQIQRKKAGKLSMTDEEIAMAEAQKRRLQRQQREERAKQQRRKAVLIRAAAAASAVFLCIGAGIGISVIGEGKKEKSAKQESGGQIYDGTQELTQSLSPTLDTEEAYAQENSEEAATEQALTEILTEQEFTTAATVAQASEIAAAVAESTREGQITDPSGIVIPEWISVELIHPNEISRPQLALDGVNDIAIHYVGNAGSSAQANRDYFDSLDNPQVEGSGRKASAHLIVGLEGEVIQCLPLNEVAYAVKSRNYDTISIEVCHPDESGKFSDVTYASLVKLTAWLLQQEGLTPDHVIRHYDCNENEKACPKYYVEHEDAWLQLKQDIADYYYAHPNIE